MTPAAYLVRAISGRYAVVGVDHGQAEQARARGEQHIYPTRKQAEAVAKRLRDTRKEKPVNKNPMDSEAFRKAEQQNVEDAKAESERRRENTARVLVEALESAASGDVTRDDLMRLTRTATADFCRCAGTLRRVKRAHDALGHEGHGPVCGEQWAQALLPIHCLNAPLQFVQQYYGDGGADALPPELLNAVADHLQQASLAFRMLATPKGKPS